MQLIQPTTFIVILRNWSWLAFFVCCSSFSFSQEKFPKSKLVLVDTLKKSTEKSIKRAPLESFTINGVYRFYAQYRMLPNPYTINNVNGVPTNLKGRSILIGDDTQLPELTLNFNGRVNSQTSFGTDLVVWNQNNGQFNYYRNLQLGINLYGNFNTEIGNFSIKMGGIHWHNMTAFTMRSFFGFNRFSLFERNPWDPQFKFIDKRYSEYYDKGAITQDARWANQAVQGFIMDVTELPWNLSANLIYGKTQNAGSSFYTQTEVPENEPNQSFIQFYRNTVPNFVYGGRLIKTIDKHKLSLNTLNRRTFLDELTTTPIDQYVATFDADLTFKKIAIAGEVGLAKYMDLPVGEMITLKVKTDKVLTKIPLQFHVFRISPNAMNNNSEFINTSVTDLQSASSTGAVVIGSNGVLQQNGSAMVGITQMTNNRQGFSVNGDFKVGALKGALALGVSKEIEKINDEISVGYTINSLTMARFWRWGFPSNVGPYGRKSVLFRSVFQTVGLTDLDDDGKPLNDKNFSNMEFQLKYKLKLFGKQLYMFYVGAYNSVQPKFSPITVFTEKAYIRHYSHQLEAYFSLTPEFMLNFYSGWERIIGNYSTRVDLDSKRPLNQSNLGFGLGFDYMIAENTGLYFRHRWFNYSDRSFELDNFKGHESTLELKIFF
ncbi:MAG: hypothetical protein RL264_875 [Bacteroidota bacterium]|jgi:hypothetical protein